MATYTLPDLRYDYGALEPHVSGRIMELHHGKHHALYVQKANEALAQLDELRAKGDLARLPAVERALAFNLSGHVLHSIFWRNLSPRGGGRPGGDLAAAIERDLGGYDALVRLMNGAAASIMGSGWAALCWEPVAGRLVTAQLHDHQGNVTQGGVPLLVIDAWEHAYYLQYESRKQDFFAALWSRWDWSDVAARFESARRLDLRLR